jgi:hypothetical protein
MGVITLLNIDPAMLYTTLIPFFDPDRQAWEPVSTLEKLIDEIFMPIHW